jgi:hypothetical protein
MPSSSSPVPPPRQPAVSIEDIRIDDDVSSPAAHVTERSLAVQRGLVKAVDDVTSFVEKAMAKTEVDVAERLLAADPHAAASPAELKAFLRHLKKSSTRIVGFASLHLSLMLDAAVSSRVLCAAAQSGRAGSEAFKARLVRFHAQLTEFAANMREHAKAADERTRAGHAVLLRLTTNGFILSDSIVYSFVPMKDVVATYNFHAARFPDLPQGLAL